MEEDVSTEVIARHRMVEEEVMVAMVMVVDVTVAAAAGNQQGGGGKAAAPARLEAVVVVAVEGMLFTARPQVCGRSPARRRRSTPKYRVRGTSI